MLDYIKFDFWPLLKTRLYFWWWIIKYRSRKNIPTEIIFAQMAKNMERLDQNLRCARSVMMDNANKEEMNEMYEVMRRVEELEGNMEKLKRK